MRMAEWAVERGLGWLLAYLGLTAAVAGLGGAATVRAVRSWYPTLRKPNWTPPNQVFGPVWTVLYVLMAVSAWLTHRRSDGSPEVARAAQAAWGVQLLLNLAWSLVFFGLRRIGSGLWVIGALDVAIVASVALSARVDRLSAGLLLPYLVWSSFASALNVRLWQLNRGRG